MCGRERRSVAATVAGRSTRSSGFVRKVACCGLSSPDVGGSLPAVPTEPPALAARSQPAPATQPSAEPSTPAVPLDGERKQVTVLFCDLVGSTAIAERLDPEEYRELIDRYLERVFPEVYRFGGIVNTLVGDGLMALFGAPIAHEDAPQRAIRAALAIRARRSVRSPTRSAPSSASSCKRGSASTLAPSSSARSGTASRWTTRRSATRRTWRRAWRRPRARAPFS